MRLIIRKTLLMFLLLSLSNVLTGFQLSAQEQNKKFSVKADNVTLKEAIEVVRKQGNYSFLIRNNDIDLNKKVSVNVDKGTINDVMAQLLTGTGISYEVNGNRVVIFHAAVPEKEQGKAFVLKGKVTDPSGEGVIGANVKVLNSTEGTITDMDGNFSLSVTPNARLSVSYIGYATQEVVVKNQTPLHIALKEDSRLIDEVVVVGYGVQKKANLTGAVSSVKMDEVLGDRPVVSVSDALKGAMPGLQITGNSGRPGEEMSFNIRGVNSLDKNGKPLVLVVSAFLHFPPFATLCKPTTCEILFRETNPKRDKNGTKSQENKIKNASSPTSLVVDFSFLCKGTILSREKQAKSSKYAAYQTFILHVHFQEDTASASCTDLCCLLQRPVKIRFMPFVHYGIAADAHCLGTVYNPSAIICNAEICVPSANW